ncbi:MAG TPA: phospholipase [Phaeodactylibacter sp.]|nr:phospholipase [Phaeodactylibacter sp.]
MYQSHKITVQKTAHYYTLGEPNAGTRRFWIICHGYGQLASRFIQQFQLFDLKENFILAPEGFHRFYWKGFTGDVVASWMTKLDRLDDIADYTSFLQQLYAEYIALLPPDVEIILFGFSQGCATQCRWINACRPHFQRLILWGGVIPEDIDYKPLLPYLANKEIIFAYGDKDPFLNIENRIARHIALAKEKGLRMKTWQYEGKHETRKKVLLDFATTVLRN